MLKAQGERQSGTQAGLIHTQLYKTKMDGHNGNFLTFFPLAHEAARALCQDLTFFI